MALRDQKRDVVRRSIMEAAYELFFDHGFDETTVEMVGARAGVSGRTVYRYFDSKEAILFDEVASETDEIAEVVRQHCATGVTMQRLVAALVEWLERRATDPLFGEMAVLMRDNPALLSQADTYRRDLVSHLATQIAGLEGADEPRLVDQARAAAVVWVTTAALTTWVDAGRTDDLVALARRAGAVLGGS